MISAGAKVLGSFTMGKIQNRCGERGAEEVPPNSTVVGCPAWW